jgi:mannose-6-phosphate isomerase-like protein (cupin superfamily)
MASRILIALLLAASPAAAQTRQPNWWSAPAREDGPPRIVWAARHNPETPYKAPNKPLWRIADILKAHRVAKSWDQPVLLNRDFDGHYISMAPGEKSKCLFYADDRAFGWIYSGQLKVTIDGQESKILSKGWAFNVAPRLSTCLETVGDEAAVFFRVTPAGQAPSYPESETPTPMKGYTYEKAKITSTGGYDATNAPFFNIDDYGASDRSGERFLFDGHTSANPRRDVAIAELPPPTDWGHFHAAMAEAWVVVYGRIDVLISGSGLVHGEFGDVINVPEERWHRATSAPGSGKSIRLSIISRSKEGQVLFLQPGGAAGN